MKTLPHTLSFGLLLSALLAFPLRSTRAQAEGAEVKFHLEQPGFVTVAIDNADGKRVRNLFGEKRFEAGDHVAKWNGLDDAGEPVPVGDYHWKGLFHTGIGAEFEGAFNSPGNPPWLTAELPGQYYVRRSGHGGWLSDHAAPTCAYSDGEHVFFGSHIAEAGHSIMELNLKGEKLWGTLWLGLSGADAIFKADDILYVAGERGWMKDSLGVFRLRPDSHKLISNPKGTKVPKGDVAFIKVKSEDFSGIKGMVVTFEYVVLSLADQGRLALFDVQTGEHIRDIPLPGAGAIVPAGADSFLAISGKKVVRLDLEDASPQTVIDGPLIEPAGLAVSSQGDILVSDVAPDQQVVKVFSPKGTLKRTIGTPGGHQEGAFDPLTMNNPRALTVDGKDQVWIGEYSFLPKRISVWTLDGQLVNSWVGPPHYGGGGALDPKDGSRGFYKGMVFDVAPWPERSKLKTILFQFKDHLDLPIFLRDEDGKLREQAMKGIPQAPVYRGDRLYLLNDQGYGVKEVFVGEVVGQHLIPRVVFGSLKGLANAWGETHPEFIQSVVPEKPDGGVFLWQDENGDGKAAPDEVQVHPEWRFGAMWAMRSWPTLNFYARSADRRQILKVSPEPGGDKLTYNLEGAEPIPLPEEIKGVTALSPDLQGNLLINSGGGGNQGDPTNMYFSINAGGEINWTYPNPYPANWHNSPRQKPGEILHTLNVEGVAPLGGDRGDIFQLNGNKGVRYLLTTDGLFVTQLYGDMRTSPLLSSLHEVKRGQRVDTYSLGDECFLGWMGKVQNGDFMQVLGKDSSNVMKITGLDTLQRLPGGEVRLEQAAQKAVEGSEIILPITPVIVGAIGKGWPDTQKHQRLDTEGEVSFAIGLYKSGMRLYVTAKDVPPFGNAGDDPKTLFKTGNAVDFRVSTAVDADPARTKPVPGDMRFLFSTLQGKPVAVRYRFVVPGVAESEKSKFASPTGVAIVDEVSIVEDAKVEIKKTDNGWTLSAYLPWKALGLDEAPTETLLGDVGLIEADPEGTRAVARHYYFDKGSQVVSDLPSEVRVNPSHWGQIEF